ncbi:MAG: type I DNA topoisomerase [Crocinitomicaceae bacterium]|tara:strand:+ start:18005 stop:20317 length:2313 start_codon:yes stop_codon:yes gene_type:complete
MSKNLVIVESPAKAKTIEGYLGKDFVVRSSFGHVRDLAKKNAIDIENGFTPNYEVSTDKKQIVAELKKLAKAAEIVWLATDEDREGEAISWHLQETLKLNEKETRRITFNEITQKAILKAITNYRTVNKKLVDAQQARRILDRIVGFELSPVLWRKVRPSLSAGRVQSVAVKLIVEREKQIIAHESSSFYKTSGTFAVKNGKVKGDVSSQFESREETEAFLKSCVHANFTVEDVQKKPATKKPTAPFTTSTLQQEASLKLGFSVSRTMSVAQRLYESGHITYMRTDSVNLSETARNAAKDAIIQKYGGSYSNPQQYRTKSSGAQEAHEAIRPSEFGVSEVQMENDESRLYELIWKRAISSQMSDAKLERTTIKIGAPQVEKTFVCKGEVIVFDGFLSVYIESNLSDQDDDDTQGLLPKVEKGEDATRLEINANERFSRAPARYVEASLVKKLEELGIGRPSTYAPTISTIQKRGYVEKKINDGTERKYISMSLLEDNVEITTKTEITGREKNKLSPTDIGVVVTDFLQDNFKDIMDYQFTAIIESQFDEIAQGELDWKKMLESFYKPFHSGVENTIENSERATGERSLGNHPESGRKIITRIGKFGPMVQVGDEKEDGIKAEFASLLSSQSISSITLEEALELFKLPRILGKHEDKDVKVNIGRFGPYVQVEKTYASIPKELDPMEIDFDTALEIYLEKVKQAEANKIKSFEEQPDLFVLNGKYGPYIKQGKANFKIPKDLVAEDLELKDCLDIIKNQPKKTRGKKKAKK